MQNSQCKRHCLDIYHFSSASSVLPVFSMPGLQASPGFLSGEMDSLYLDCHSPLPSFKNYGPFILSFLATSRVFLVVERHQVPSEPKLAPFLHPHHLLPAPSIPSSKTQCKNSAPPFRKSKMMQTSIKGRGPRMTLTLLAPFPVRPRSEPSSNE